MKSLSFSVDGMYLASVGEDRAVCIHRLGNRKSVVELAENNWPTNQVTSCDFCALISSLEIHS